MRYSVLNKIKISLFTLLVLLFTSQAAYTTGIPGRRQGEEVFAKIDSIIKGLDCKTSVKVVSASRNDLLYEYKPGLKMIPASITKLVTSSTAIYMLGAGYIFRTVVFTDDNKMKNGVINGNVYIKGFGDPDISSGDIMYLAQQIVSKQIKQITGNIIFDDSFLDGMHYGLADYYKGDTGFGDWPYVCALSFNKNKGYKNPAEAAAIYLMESLKANNVTCDGIVISGATPKKAHEIAVLERTLYDVITNMNKPSDNQSAITLYKVIGAIYGSTPGTLKKGTEAVIDFLSSINIDRRSFDFVEGSGLSRYNYVTADFYMNLLKYMYDDEKYFDMFYSSLPIGGIDGTLRNRMKNTEAEKNIHAKTGTLHDVSTLTGYAVSRDGELLMFYIAMNEIGGAAYYRNRQDDICSLICQYTRK